MSDKWQACKNGEVYKTLLENSHLYVLVAQTLRGPNHHSLFIIPFSLFITYLSMSPSEDLTAKKLLKDLGKTHMHAKRLLTELATESI
jgi:hypothetical protein